MENAFLQLGISLALGLLVGLQREHSASGVAGLRTFPLIAVLGTVLALIARSLSDSAVSASIVAAGLIGVSVVVVLAHFSMLRRSRRRPGSTTDMAMLLMYAVGAYLVYAPSPLVPVAVGGGVAVLLQFKPELHKLAKTLGDDDLRAIMQFVLISCIILPVLPNRKFGLQGIFPHFPEALNVFNPFETWLMVVLIVGMSLTGYILYKFFGRDAGLVLGGMLGGIISSTATTVSYSRQCKSAALNANSAALVIMIASTLSCVRVLLSMAIISPEFMVQSAAPVGAMILLSALPAFGVWRANHQSPYTMPEQKNPTQLAAALVFGLTYAAVLFLLAAAHRFGEGSQYSVAAISGLTEMDAVTLSTARMALGDSSIMENGWRLIISAILANMFSKAVIARILGGRELFMKVALLFSIPALGGAACLAFLP